MQTVVASQFQTGARLVDIDQRAVNDAEFLRQGNNQPVTFNESLDQLGKLLMPVQGVADTASEGSLL